MTEQSGVRRWVRRAVAGAVLAAGVAVAQNPPKAAPPTTPAPAVDGGRAVAVINGPGGSVTITQEEFGKYLTDRGGADKIDLFVNKRIIEQAATQAKIEVTAIEMEASLKRDMAGIVANQDEFVKIVLPKYGKTLYEWMEDVVRPRLLLEKMCAAEKRVKVSDADLKVQYERLYGEKRKVQIIIWPKGDDEKAILRRFAEVRKSQDEFDSAARAQPNPGLAASKGHILPMGRYTQASDTIVEDTAFKLKVGEVSELLRTEQGWVVIKLHEVVPPTTATTFDKEKDKLHAAAADEKLQQELPKKFAELKTAANPQVQYVPPKEWQALTPTGGTGSVLTPGRGLGK